MRNYVMLPTKEHFYQKERNIQFSKAERLGKRYMTLPSKEDFYTREAKIKFPKK